MQLRLNEAIQVLLSIVHQKRKVCRVTSKESALVRLGQYDIVVTLSRFISHSSSVESEEFNVILSRYA
jgi:ribosomal protein S18